MKCWHIPGTCLWTTEKSPKDPAPHQGHVINLSSQEADLNEYIRERGTDVLPTLRKALAALGYPLSINDDEEREVHQKRKLALAIKEGYIR